MLTLLILPILTKKDSFSDEGFGLYEAKMVFTHESH